MNQNSNFYTQFPSILSNGRRSRGNSHIKPACCIRFPDGRLFSKDYISRGLLCECRLSASLSNRWAAAMHLYNDPTVDVSERPVMYHGGDVLNEAKPLQIQASGKQDTTSTKVAK
ncbi:uncharacterized protein LOC111206462 [Brassica napus]|nr:uncharacterized protein LOC111206462 [Brassica napus]